MERKKMLFKLFFATLYLSAFTFGGGYVIVTLMKKKFVDEYHWIAESEMLDFVAIAQSAPGPIAVNGAIVVGYQLAKLPGAFIAILGTILPPFLIISAISAAYEIFRDNIWIKLMLEGMQAGVGAVISAVSLEMASGIVKQKSPVPIAVMLLAFICNFCFGIDSIYIILACILLGLLWSVFMRRGAKR